MPVSAASGISAAIRNNARLVAFSLLFYAWGEPVCVFLMIGLVAADYLFGRLIGATRIQSRRKQIAALTDGPVFAEVLASDAEGMIREGRELHVRA